MRLAWAIILTTYATGFLLIAGWLTALAVTSRPRHATVARRSRRGNRAPRASA